MELVYLWVEKYKNIHKKGFNFSPRFECKYENNELNICDKKKKECKNNDYIENFFAKNINITAIVGKNGSGKSSLLKVIRQIIDQKINDGSFLIFYEKAQNKYICIYTLNKINSNIEFEQYQNMSNHIVFPLFDYSLTYDSSINFQNEQLPVYPKKLNGFLDFQRELNVNKKNIIDNFIKLKRKNLIDKFNDFFQPNKIEVILDLEKFKPSSNEKLKEEQEIKYKNLIDKFQNQLSIQEALYYVEELINLLSNVESYQDRKKDPFEQIQLLPTLERELRRLEYANYDYNGRDIAENIWEEEKAKRLFLDKNKLDSILLEIENKYLLFSFDIDDSIDDIINIILDSFPLTYFQIELIDINDKKLNSLSFGEQQLLFILNQIYSLGIVFDKDLYDSISPKDIIEQGHDIETTQRFYKVNYIMLFDEIDTGFHPDWQKKMLQYIIDFLNATDDEKYYHLIFTTHSPFLLSDIPNENIIFLNDESSIKQTFGANIHTLLSDSFFMDNGLMGEFAKNTIEEVVNFLQEKKSEIESYEEASQIIEIIGEPILQMKLEKMLENYKKKNNLESEDDIKKQIRELQRKLKEKKNHG